MWIDNLNVNHCRLLDDINIVLSKDLNIILGENASGKTSLLESLSLLSSGKSFRTSHINNVISHDQSAVLVSARLNFKKSNSQIGIEKSTTKTRIRINKQDVYSQAELSRHLPITIMHPESIELITGSPSYRRSFIDWITFYLYPEFHDQWKNYRHILKQRNLCLKDPKHKYALPRWTEELIQLQPSISGFRIKAIDKLKKELTKVSKELLSDNNVNSNKTSSVELVFNNGFPADIALDKESLKQFYLEKEEYDLKIKRTSSGVHRADIKIMLDGKPAIQAASRGQLKLLAITLLLAQSTTINIDKEEKGIIVIDDLAAELDSDNKNKLIRYLSTLQQQLIITTTKKLEIGNIPCKLFHVKHGVFTEIN
jgi:DNA replication and repair protein RecF